MKFHDTVLGLAFFALAMFIFAYALTIPPMPGQQYGADVFPRLIATGLGGFSLLLAWRGWRSSAPGAPWVEIAPWARDPRTRGNFILAFVLTIAYVVLDETIGFIPLGIAILMILFLRQGVPWRRGLIIAVAMVVATQVAFGSLLRVPLPRGVLTDYLW
jgi:putative tricarboxylic transport membrane protein